MSDVTYSSSLKANKNHVFVADFRLVPDNVALRSQLVTWSSGRWYVANTPDVYPMSFKAHQTPESVYREALAECLSSLKEVLRSGGVHEHPVLDLEQLPDTALELAMDERQLAFVYHVLGWGHTSSDYCRFCSRFEESPK